MGLATVLALAGTAEAAAGDGQEIIVVGNEQIPGMLPYSALLASLAVLDSVVHLTEDGAALAVAPFFHIYGMNVIMNPALAAGATLVTMARFELGAFLRAIEQHKVTVLHAMPPIINALARHPAVAGADLSLPIWRRLRCQDAG